MSNLLKDAIMHPTPHLRRHWLLICGVAVTIIVIGLLNGCSAGASGLTGASPSATALPRGAGSDAARPTPAQPAATASAPDGPVTVIPGKHTINGVELGFPHTVAGAISAAADDETELTTLDASRATIVGRLIADPSNSNLPSDAANGAESFREAFGIPATGPVPAGYSFHFKATEYQLRNVASDKVTVLLLCDLSYTQPRLGVNSRIGVFPLFMHWVHGDWKENGDAGPVYMYLSAAPHSARASALGWKALLY